MSEQKFLVKVDRASGAANVIELKPSWMQRVVQAAQYVMRPGQAGQAPNWFGPGTPLQPQAPVQLEGRQLDYPMTFNLNSRPKTGEDLPSIPFPTLRRFADAYDILRLLIETRKDQICKLEWEIAPRDPKVKPDKRCDDLRDFFAMPDKEHVWDEWLRMLLEDNIVVDAACLYPRLARDGSLYALEPIDGTTIKRIIDDYGRTPLPPFPAYQQYIKGVPAFNYTTEQLIYRPRNIRTSRLYGYSIVEQIVVSVTLGLNRQAYQLQYFNEGSTPDLIMACPPEWTPEQVKQFSEYWDSRLQGMEGQRRGTMFVYSGMEAIDTKERAMADKFDEWLARVCCFAFGMSPQPFVAQVNRATAESAAEQAKEEGVGPQMRWVANLIDGVITRNFGMPDLRFKWKDEEDVDPDIADQIEDRRIRRGALTINEARAARGEEPLEGGDVALIYTGTGATPLATVEESAQAGLDAQRQLAEGGDPLGNNAGDEQDDTSLDDTKKNVEKLAKASPLRKQIAKVFAALAQSVAKQVSSKMAKANARDVNDILDSLDFGMLGDLQMDFINTASPAYRSVFAKAAKSVGAKSDIFNLAPTRASEYAAKRAGELISSGPDGGELGDSTRLLIRDTIEQALDEGWSTDELAAELADSYGFSAARADAIADNELQTAVMRGQYDGWKATGAVVGKQWLLSNDEDICDVCQGNADQGTVDIDSDFSSGDDAPPAHPNCRCDMAPVLNDDAE